MVNEDLYFPTEEDFQNEIYQADDIPSAISSLKDLIVSLYSEKPDNLKKKEIDWINQTLTKIWPLIIHLEHPSRPAIREATNFNFELLKLIVKIEFNPNLVNILVSFFDFGRIDPQSFEIKKIDAKKRNEIMKSLNDNKNILKKDRPSASGMITSLAELLFTSGFFKNAIKSAENNKFTVDNIYPILNLILHIEPLISTNYISILIPTFFDASLNLLQTKKLNDSCIKIGSFLTTIGIALIEKLDTILKLFCDLSSLGSINVRISFITNIIQIIDSVGPGTSADYIKDTMIKITLDKSTHHSLLSKIFNFLPSLSQYAAFTESDLNILIKSSSSFNERFQCIILLISKEPSSVDTFSKTVLESNIFFPPLYCTLIEHTKSTELSKELFFMLLSNPDRLSNYDLSSLELNDVFIQRIEELLSSMSFPSNIHHLKSLSYLFLCSSQTAVLPKFLKYLIGFLDQNDDDKMENVDQYPDLFQILNKFTGIIGKIDSKSIILKLFKITILKISDYSENKYTNSLISLLTKWMQCMKSVSNENMLSNIIYRMYELDFIKVNYCVFPLVCVILKQFRTSLEKNTNEATIKNSNELMQSFLMKILYDTVNPDNAKWLIDELFGVIHQNNELMQQVSTMLISHLSVPEKRKNAIYLVYYAAKYEADYFRLQDNNFGFNQKFLINIDSNTILNISFHPFHTAKRLYYYISKCVSTEFNNLKINVVKRSKTIHLDINSSLSSIGLTPYETLKLEISHQKNDDNMIDPASDFKTPFLNNLVDLNYLNIIFQFLEPGKLETEYLFQILMLFQPFNNITFPLSKNTIQSLFLMECEDPNAYRSYRAIYPYALYIYSSLGKKMTKEYMEFTFDEVLSSDIFKTHTDSSNETSKEDKFDSVSLSMACSALFNIGDEYEFDKQSIQKNLIEADVEIIRQTFLSLLSPKIGIDTFISLIPKTMENKNRCNSKQFYLWLKFIWENLYNEKDRKYPREIFLPFFKELNQYELSYYSNVDETYIALLDLVPINEDVVKLTIQRLFSPPSCHNLSQPFIHTIESWKASLELLLNKQSHSFLSSFFLASNLPQTPSISLKLSDDFTFKGRCGIVNLGSTCYVNSLLQVFNVLPNISLKLINKTCDNFSPFVERLRELLAELRYIHGNSISIKPLVDTIPNFNVTQQEDAAEFFTFIVDQINANIPEIVNQLEGEMTYYIECVDDRNFEDKNVCGEARTVVSSNKDNFYYLPLPIKGYNNICDALKNYFEEYPLDEGYSIDGNPNNKVTAYQRNKITKWPNYLCIQLQRWDYAIETQEKHKLEHEVDFPLEFDTSSYHTEENCIYSLKGVVVHQGSAEQGHYFAIVQDDESQWYLCNDQIIEYFDIDKISDWAFGIPSDINASNPSKVTSTSTQSNSIESINDKSTVYNVGNIGTGYLLFYEKKGIEKFYSPVPSDLEDKLNKENSLLWPSTIFYSPEFSEFASDLILLCTQNKEVIYTALTVFFKIAAVDERTICNWSHILCEFVFNSSHIDLCYMFFDFIESNLKKSFGSIVSMNDSYPKVTLHVFQLLRDTTKPLIITLTNLAFSTHRRAISTAYSVIYFACKNFNIDWSEEECVLFLIVQYISLELPKETSKIILKQHWITLDIVMFILLDVFQKKGCISAIIAAFSIDNLNKIYSSAKKSDNFYKLMNKVNSARPDLFEDVDKALRSVKQLLMPIISFEATLETGEANIINSDFLWNNFPNYLFNKDISIRRKSSILAIRILGEIEPSITQFYDEALVNESSRNQKPLFQESSAISLYFIGLIPHACQILQSSKKSEYCDYFLDVLIHVCRLNPAPAGLYFKWIAIAFFATKNSKLFIIMHDLLSFDISLKEDFSPEDVDELLNTSSCASKEAVHILYLFKSKIANSAMYGSCIEYYLKHNFDQGADIITQMIKSDIVPGDFEIPERADNIQKLKFANALWESLPNKREQLTSYMISALKLAKPFNLFSHSSVVKASCQLLQQFDKNILNDII